jgi:hypothetical protein
MWYNKNMTKQTDMASMLKLEQLDLFSRKRHTSYRETSRLFDEYHIWEFIDDTFEGLHIQGAFATYEDISGYIGTRGTWHDNRR